MKNSNEQSYLKWVALLLLLIQNSGIALTMRYSRIARPVEDAYITSTAVLVAEFVKLIFSTCLCIIIDCNYDFQRFRNLIYVEFVEGKKEFLKLFVPSGLYVIQNNLQYIATSNLSAEVYQVLSNLKIVTTAILSFAILGKKLSSIQWISIFALTFGVAIVQVSQNGKASISLEQNQILGLLCVLSASCTSGFAGVYFEKVLKSTNSSIWLRNIQLAIIGIGFAMVTCIANDFDHINIKGFFHGYDMLVCIVILLAALGGLVVAVVVKYADNVLKGFAASASIVLSCIVSKFLLDDSTINGTFIIGAILVCSSAYVYSK